MVALLPRSILYSMVSKARLASQERDRKNWRAQRAHEMGSVGREPYTS